MRGIKGKGYQEALPINLLINNKKVDINANKSADIPHRKAALFVKDAKRCISGFLKL